jgi:predicted dehydrogenase
VTGFGLIGCGAIGEFRAQALKQTPKAELKQVVDALPERSAAFAARFGVRAAATIDDLLASPGIDAVIVSTPPNLHREHCEKALRAGKHVLCEKPLASTVDDCYRIVKTAAACGKTLATGFNYRFYPAVVKARELIADGRIGEVDHVKSFAGHPGGPEFTHRWVHDATIMGGGALMDNGIHAADLTLHFLGEIVESYGLATENVWQFAGSEDNGFVMMRTPKGRVGTLHASWSEWRGYRFHVDVYGTKGCVRVWYPPMMTVLYERPIGSAKRGARKTFLFPVFQLNERLRSYRWTIVRSFVAEHQDFLQRLQGYDGVGATGLDGLRAVEMVASAYRSRASIELALASLGDP